MSAYDWEDDAKGSWRVAIDAQREQYLVDTIPGVKRARVIQPPDPLAGVGLLGGGEGRSSWGLCSPRFTDGKSKDANGYVTLTSRAWGEHQGRREHQLVAEMRILFRPLQANEIVHHKNGIKDDNRPENLDVLLRSQHPREHGLGREMACVRCGVVRWLSPAQIKRAASPENYTCKKCSTGVDFDRVCKRCAAAFKGGKSSQYCGDCTRKFA